MVEVFFYVQHLLGIGHLRRATLVAKALDRAGLSVVLVSGGMPVEGLDIGGARLVQLSPVKSRDAAFSALVDETGRVIDETWKADRRDQLLSLFQETAPRVLLVEQFPFGRRQLRFELLPLIAAAERRGPRPWILASVRDILNQPSNPEKTASILKTVKRWFDCVLVHGDPDFVPLEQSFPQASEIADRLRYTGYVTAEDEFTVQHGDDGAGDVLVSTGGGAVAAALISAALEARPLSPLRDQRWRILVGDNLDQDRFAAAKQAAPPGIEVERSRPDFPALLRACRLSISQAGYNTIMDVLRAGPPAVVVPFAAPGETEQSLRAELLAARGLVTVVEEAGLDGPNLARGIALALERANHGSAPDTAGRPASGLFAMDGAARTAEIVSELVAILPLETKGSVS